MSTTRKLVRVGVAGGAVYYSYNLGLWKSTDETIENYEKFKGQVQTAYNKVPPSITHFAEDKAKLAKQKTIDPVTESVTSFQKKWLNFDYSWMESEDGVIKPAWNKGVAVVCNFIAHAPEKTVDLSAKGWNYVSGYVTESSDAVAKAAATSASSSATDQ